MNTRVTIKRIFLLYITLSTAQLPAVDLSVMPFALSLVNLAQKGIGYLPALTKHISKVKQYIPIQKIKQYIPLHIINGNKKPIIAGATAIALAGILYIRQKNKNKREIRERIEEKLEGERNNFFIMLSSKILTLFSTKFWKILWGVRNVSLNNTINGNGQKIQGILLEEIVSALIGPQFLHFEVLVEIPFWKSQLVDPNIKLPRGEEETIVKQIENGYKQIKNTLEPKFWIRPLQFVIECNIPNFNSKNKLSFINTLLSNGAKPLYQDHNRNDALHYAVKSANPDIEIIKCLIEAKARADIPNKNSITCMHLVSNIKDEETRKKVAEILVRCKPDMRITNKKGDTPLLYAVKMDRVDLVELFLSDTNVEIDQVDEEGNSILMLAMNAIIVANRNNRDGNPHKKIITYLFTRFNIDKITDLANKKGHRPIHYAAICQSHQLIDFLMNHNVNIVRATETILSPIQYVFKENNRKALFTFLNNNTLLTNFTPTEGNTIAHLIADLSEEVGPSSFMDLAAQKGFPLHETNDAGKKPFEIALKRGSMLAYWFIQKPDTDRNITFANGTTPAHIVAQLDNEKVAVRLITSLRSNRFPLNTQNDAGETILHTAVQQENEQLINWITRNYAWLKTTANHQGQTPLHYAGKQGKRKLYEQLNPTEAEQDTVDALDKTPRQLLGENEPILSKSLNILKKPINFYREVSSNLKALSSVYSL